MTSLKTSNDPIAYDLLPLEGFENQNEKFFLKHQTPRDLHEFEHLQKKQIIPTSFQPEQDCAIDVFSEDLKADQNVHQEFSLQTSSNDIEKCFYNELSQIKQQESYHNMCSARMKSDSIAISGIRPAVGDSEVSCGLSETSATESGQVINDQQRMIYARSNSNDSIALARQKLNEAVELNKARTREKQYLNRPSSSYLPCELGESNRSGPLSEPPSNERWGSNPCYHKAIIGSRDSIQDYRIGFPGPARQEFSNDRIESTPESMGYQAHLSSEGRMDIIRHEKTHESPDPWLLANSGLFQSRKRGYVDDNVEYNRNPADCHPTELKQWIEHRSERSNQENQYPDHPSHQSNQAYNEHTTFADNRDHYDLDYRQQQQFHFPFFTRSNHKNNSYANQFNNPSYFPPQRYENTHYQNSKVWNQDHRFASSCERPEQTRLQEPRFNFTTPNELSQQEQFQERLVPQEASFGHDTHPKMSRPPRHPFYSNQPLLSNSAAIEQQFYSRPSSKEAFSDRPSSNELSSNPLSQHQKTHFPPARQLTGELPSLADSPLFRERKMLNGTASRPTTAAECFTIPFRGANYNQNVKHPTTGTSTYVQLHGMQESIQLAESNGKAGGAIPIANKKHSENEILPALKHKRSNANSTHEAALEPLDFEALLEETLKKEDSIGGSNSTTGDEKNKNELLSNRTRESSDNEKDIKLPTKRPFLRKGSRNPFTKIPPKLAAQRDSISITCRVLSHTRTSSSNVQIGNAPQNEVEGKMGKLQQKKVVQTTAQGRRFSAPAGAVAQQKTDQQRISSPNEVEALKTNPPLTMTTKNASRILLQRNKTLEQNLQFEAIKKLPIISRPKISEPKRPATLTALDIRKQQNSNSKLQPQCGQLTFPPPAVPQKSFVSDNVGVEAASSPLGRVVIKGGRPRQKSFNRHYPARSDTSSIDNVDKSVCKENSGSLLALMTTATGGGDFDGNEIDDMSTSEWATEPKQMIDLEPKRIGRLAEQPSPARRPTSSKRGRSPVDLLDEIDCFKNDEYYKKGPECFNPITAVKTSRSVSQTVKNNFAIPDPSSTLFGSPGASYGEMKRRELKKSPLTDKMNTIATTLKKEPQLNTLPETDLKECLALAAQAQAKIAAVDEEIKRIQALKTDLRQKKDALDAEQKNWMMERDKLRLALAAEREAAIADIEASKKELKKERKRFEGDLEELQEISVENEKLEEQNRQLRVQLARLQDEFLNKEERYRTIIDRLQNKNHLLERKNKSLNVTVEQFELTSQQLSQRLLQQQKAAARTAGLKNPNMIARSKSQPAISLAKKAGNRQILGFGSSQPRFPDSNKLSSTEVSVRKSTSDFHTHQQSSRSSSTSSRQFNHSDKSNNFPRSIKESREKHRDQLPHRKDLSKSLWSEWSACSSISSSEETPILGNSALSDHSRVVKSLSHRSPADSSEFGAGASTVPDEEKMEEIEARCRRPTYDLNCAASLNRTAVQSSGGFNEEGLRNALEQIKVDKMTRKTIHHRNDLNNPQINHGSITSDQSNNNPSVVEKNPLPISEYYDLLSFNLEVSWKPFDEALKSLALPDAIELSQPATIKPDGRQELVYKDGNECSYELGEDRPSNSLFWLAADQRQTHILLWHFLMIAFIMPVHYCWRSSQCPNGWIFSFFSNGDIRGLEPNGCQFYYFHRDTIYNITAANGKVYNSFPDGQVDCQSPGGKVQVRFPQGYLKQIDVDGTEHVQKRTS